MLVIDNDDDGNNDNDNTPEVLIRYFTPYGDIEARSRHKDIFKTFYSLFYQWFNNSIYEKITAEQFIDKFSSIDEDMIKNGFFDNVMIDAIQRLPEQQQSAFALVIFVMYDLLNKIDKLNSTKIIKLNISRAPSEYWINFRKCQMEYPELMVRIVPLINDINTHIIMLIQFISAYDELSQHPIWNDLYTFMMINLINCIDKIIFRPNARNIGAFINITDDINNIIQH